MLKRKTKLLEDGSEASTGHKPKKKKSTKASIEAVKDFKKIINVDESLDRQIETDRKVEAYSYRIRQEIKKLSSLTEEISAAYSAYAESNDKIDSSPTIHNGLANTMKLIEVQTTIKLRIKKMQTAIMQAIASTTPDDELPYAMQDIMREVNVNFLDSKLVRAYGEIARIMKEDLELAKHTSNEIQFVPDALSSELESMETVDITNDVNDNVEEDDEENDAESDSESDSDEV